jgi:hypothetical protein
VNLTRETDVADQFILTSKPMIPLPELLVETTGRSPLHCGISVASAARFTGRDGS